MRKFLPAPYDLLACIWAVCSLRNSAQTPDLLSNPGEYKETATLVRNPQAPRTIMYGGIAAFPSLHVALLTLFALVSRSISITWFKINLLFVVFMVIGSVVTGYHYLVDSYAGLLLGWGAYYLAKLWVSKWDREDTEDANESSKGIASVEKHQLPKPPEVEEPPPNT